MRLLALFLGITTVVCLTMVGAIASMMAQVPERSFLKILGHWLQRKDYSQGTSRVEARERLARVRHLLGIAAVALLAGAAAAGIAGVMIDSGIGYGAMATLFALAFNLAVLRGLANSWRKRLCRPPH